MKVLMNMNDWSGICGYFFDFDANIELEIEEKNNGYNCWHSNRGHKKVGVGGCHVGVCPLGYEADEESCMKFGVEYEEAKYIIVDIREDDYDNDTMFKLH